MSNQLTSILGIDIGTTNLKAILYDESLHVLETVSCGYSTQFSDEGHAEQSVEAILEAFYTCVNQLVKENYQITSLNFSAAMHSLLLLDEQFKPLTKNIIWSDNRAAKVIDHFKMNHDWISFYQKSGTPIHAMSPFAKLLWFQDQELFKQAHYFCGMKEYLLYTLTGKFVCDYSIASATGLFNSHQLTWDKEILDFLNIQNEQLPQLVEVTTQLELLPNHRLQHPESFKNTKIVIGASDGCLANLGTHTLNKGEVSVTLGTSGAIRMTVDHPLLDEQGRTFCYYLMPGKWVIGGATNNGGNVVDWLTQLLYNNTEEMLHDLESKIDSLLEKNDRLIFVPHLHGERAPYWDATLFAHFVNLRPTHQKHDLMLAAIEGILFNLKNVWKLLENLSNATTSIKVTGKLLSHPLLIKLLATIFNQPIKVSVEEEQSVLGAVLLTHEILQQPHYIEVRPIENKVGLFEDKFESFNQISNILN